MLSWYLPLPPMLILAECAWSILVNSRLVNWRPWSVLNTSGVPRFRALTSASAQKSVSRVLDNLQPTTYRLCQSMITTK